jgi:glycosyltransferase involved in cell wall biosynthesis
MTKKILFISGIDFKEKSIQVIRKTPEAYVHRGWDVHYLVLRDVSKRGNYFYEKPLNPSGVKVFRYHFFFSYLLNVIPFQILRTIANKIISYIGVYQLLFHAIRLIRNNEYCVLYGYEHIGTRTVSLLKFFGKARNCITVSRFQGTWLALYYKSKRYLKLLLNVDFYLAMRFKSDLCIMTDDGTQGDFIMRKIQPKHPDFRFWVNGVDFSSTNNDFCNQIKANYNLENKISLISVSRLESWKRVDRVINIVNQFCKKNPNLKHKLVYLVVGEGIDRPRLEQLVNDLDLRKQIKFVGAIPNDKVPNYLKVCKVFMSFYDLSNVGNPLLEAMRMNKVIMTLSNGDTSKWISHKKTGFIYNPKEGFYDEVADDLALLVKDDDLIRNVTSKLLKFSEEKLWTWEERFNEEVKIVESKLKC